MADIIDINNERAQDILIRMGRDLEALAKLPRKSISDVRLEHVHTGTIESGYSTINNIISNLEALADEVIKQEMNDLRTSRGESDADCDLQES